MTLHDTVQGVNCALMPSFSLKQRNKKISSVESVPDHTNINTSMLYKDKPFHLISKKVVTVGAIAGIILVCCE